MLSILKALRRKPCITASALHRILQQEFLRTRTCNCSCKMPAVIEAERQGAGEANWAVGKLWGGCRRCHATLEQVARRNACLFDIKPDPAEPEEQTLVA